MMMMSFIALAIVPVLWVLYGYSLAFGPTATSWPVGGFDRVGLDDITASTRPTARSPSTSSWRSS